MAVVRLERRRVALCSRPGRGRKRLGHNADKRERPSAFRTGSPEQANRARIGSTVDDSGTERTGFPRERSEERLEPSGLIPVEPLGPANKHERRAAIAESKIVKGALQLLNALDADCRSLHCSIVLAPSELVAEPWSSVPP